jgi:probable F420-dependent oxidoreductase
VTVGSTGRAPAQGPALRRTGVTLPLRGLSLHEHRSVVTEMIGLGYDHAWAGEASGIDAISPLAAAAAWAPGLGIGTAVVPVQTRGPALMAMTAAALAELAPGRSALGLGVSSPAVVHGWNDRTFDRPLQRVTDLMRFLREAFAGRSVSRRYPTFEVTNFRLDRPVPSPPDLLVAALRPRMLQLAATEADGAITTTVSAEDIPTIRDHLGPEGRLVVWVSVCPSADAVLVRDLARPNLTAYLCLPAYRAQQVWLGRSARLDSTWRAWDRGDYNGAALALPDSVIDELVVHGSAAACRSGIARFFAAGATDVSISLDPVMSDPLGALRALAPAVGG